MRTLNAPTSEEIDYSYSWPKTFLPLNSKNSSSQATTARYSQAEIITIRSTLVKVVGEATKLYTALKQHIVSMSELTIKLARLNAMIIHAHNLLELELRLLAQTEDYETSAEAVTDMLRNQSAELLSGYVIYDRYFNVIRIRSMSISQLAAQVAATSQGVLNDLPFALLGIDEILVIIKTIKLMFESLLQNFYPNADGMHPAPNENDASIQAKEHPHRWASFWEHDQNDAEKWTHKVAFYRWMIGHHFFNLCSIFCRENLILAGVAFEKNEETTGGQFLQMAKEYLRATTAAMWYAGNFPAQTYRGEIRQSMVQAGAPGGFSGNQNLDYTFLKEAKDQLRKTILSKYGNNSCNWPIPVYNAVSEFREIYLHDMEQHILIAAAKVGTDTSLTQKVWQQGLPIEEVRLKNAVDVLRAMARLRQQEFNL